ncbi:MAG: hypothetical protein D6788_07545, partial [Planctomycetota bacterium]
MKTRVRVCVALLSMALLAGTAWANNRPNQFDFEFRYVVQNSKDIPDDGVLTFLLDGPFIPGTNTPYPTPGDLIQYLELEVSGLSHDAPWDLNFILLDPAGLKVGQQGSGIVVMEDAGYFGPGFELSDANDNSTLLFADKGIPLPLTQADGPLQGWPDTIYAPGGPGSFSQYNGLPVGNSPWLFVVTDDAAGVQGSLQSVILRGVVPEPATLM